MCLTGILSSQNETRIRVSLITGISVITCAVAIIGVALWAIGAAYTLPHLALAGTIITSVSVGPIVLALLVMLALAIVCSPCLFACACMNRKRRHSSLD